MVFTKLPSSNSDLNEDGQSDHENGVELSPLERLASTSSRFSPALKRPGPTNIQVVSDAAYVDEPESFFVKGSSPPGQTSPKSLNSPSSPFLPGEANTKHRLFSKDSYENRWNGKQLSPPLNARQNTRKSTASSSLSPQMILDEATRNGSPRKSTLHRGLSMALSPGVVPFVTIEDPEALESFWSVYAKEASDYDRRMIASWNRSLDVRLLFSGIFSAIVTPFIIESYKLLTPENDPSFFGTDGYKVRVNAMWFGSLIVSLITALFSIHCKQWLDGYTVDMHFTSENRDAALKRTCRLRQYRFQSLQNFYINQVIGLIPVFLYISLLFFAVGLVDFLWHLNKGIAIYVSVLCGLVAIFHVFTTVIPFFTTRTPFRTPLSDFLGNLWRGMLKGELRVKGLMEEEEKLDVDRHADILDGECFKWLQNNTDSEEHFKLGLRAEGEFRRVQFGRRRSDNGKAESVA